MKKWALESKWRFGNRHPENELDGDLFSHFFIYHLSNSYI